MEVVPDIEGYNIERYEDQSSTQMKYRKQKANKECKSGRRFSDSD